MYSSSDNFNPFPGLRAFEEHEDILFFGREKQIDELLKKLRTTRFLAVIGASGSGKSSLVKSGLIPALYSGFMSGAGSSWRITTFRPGSDPIGNLAEALSKDGILYNHKEEDEEKTLKPINEAILRRSNFGLFETYKQSGLDPRNNLLVLVDQFEELFRFSKYEKEAKEGKRDSLAFINLLLKATEQKDFPIYVVFTMRSDFLGDCTEFRGLPEAINQGQYLVPRMTREERKEAISGPIAVGGAQVSQRLLNRLLNDVGDNPDQLPILQHALMRTWDAWRSKENPDKEIDIEEYDEIGTMDKALSQHAEEAYAELSNDKQRNICEAVFKGLTDRGSDSRGIRRPTKLNELAALANVSIAETAEIIEIFRKEGRAFLMPPFDVPLNENSIIDISHESLMRVWSRLINWVNEENESIQVYNRLCEAANLYELGKGGLWRDPELQIALKWREENQPNSTWALRYNNYFEKAILFLEYSNEQYFLEQKRKEELQKLRLKRAKRFAIIISMVALLAFFFAIYAFFQQMEANKQRIFAEKKQIEADNQRKLAEEEETRATKSEYAARQEKEIAERERKKAIASEQNALLQKSIAESQKGIAEKQKQLAQENEKLAKDQQQIAEEQTQKAVKNEKLAIEQKNIADKLKNLSEARNLAYNSLLLLNEGKYQESKNMALEAYQKHNENGGGEQNNDIFNALNFNWEKETNYSNLNQSHNASVRKSAYNSAFNVILTADESGVIVVSNLENDKLIEVSKYYLKDQIRDIKLSADGKKVATISFSGNIHLLSFSGKDLSLLNTFKISGNGKRLSFDKNDDIIALSNKSLSRFESANNYQLKENLAHDTISYFSLNHEGGISFAAKSAIYFYNTWEDLKTRNATKVGFNAPVTCFQIDSENKYLTAGTDDGRVTILSRKNNSVLLSLALHQSAVNDLLFFKLANGVLKLATAGYDQTIKIISVKAAIDNDSKEDVITLRGHSKWVYDLNYHQKNNMLISTGEDKKVITWKVSMQQLVESLKAENK